MIGKASVFIVAVSGGVDSVCLLDMLVKDTGKILGKQDCRLVVAHFDHGIRPGSADDAEFVRDLAKKYNLQFETERVELGEDASEEKARQARYTFLGKIADKYHGQIVTAHHQDDVIETAIINMLRGTNRKGLTALKSGIILRPLLNMSKKQVLEYADGHNLTWREDSTNSDTRYLRNYIRHNIVPKFLAKDRQKLLQIIDDERILNQEIDDNIAEIVSGLNLTKIPRDFFTEIDTVIINEILVHILKDIDGTVEISQERINYILEFIKTGKPTKRYELKNVRVRIEKKGFVSIQRR